MKFKPATDDFNFLHSVIQFEEEIVNWQAFTSRRRWRCRICGSYLYSNNDLQFNQAVELHSNSSPSCFSLVIPVYEEPA